MQALTTYGSEKLSLSDAQELLSQIEPDENGLINYVEFVNMSARPRPRTLPAPGPHAGMRVPIAPRRLAKWHLTSMVFPLARLRVPQ